MSRRKAAAGGPIHLYVELAFTTFVALFGLIIIIGSLRVGIGWADDGPRAGFFPFYVGLFIVGASVINFARALSENEPGKLFADWGQLVKVLSVVIPTAVYVALVPFIGIYVASALLIGLFMKWLGKYGWVATLGVSIGVPLFIFVVFERWFLVALPKGPIENMLGF